jgi:uncharacterized protein (UPF0303 family)
MKNTSDAAHDLAIIAKQEELLHFDAFDNATAWLLGERMKRHCEDRNVAVTIEIRLCGNTVFFFAMPGTSPNNAEWARRKRNTTEMHQRSSYAVGLALLNGESLESQTGLSSRDYASHGGSVPIRVKGIGFVGAATISGLPQREDHNIVVQTLAAFIGVPLIDCNLT